MTEALDEQRARQRRWLRGLPTSRLQQNPIPRLDFEAGDDASLVEQELRDRADRALENVSDEAIDLEREKADLLYRWSQAYDFRAPMRHDPLLEPMAEISNHASRVRTAAPDVPDEVWYPALRAAALMVWADDLAGDGYCDPRVKKMRDRREGAI